MTHDLSYFSAERDDDQFEVIDLPQSEEIIIKKQHQHHQLPPTKFINKSFSTATVNSIYHSLMETPYNINSLDLNQTFVKVH
jgi:hypothetical protein